MASPKLSCETYRISDVPHALSDSDVRKWFSEAEEDLILKITHVSLAPDRKLTQESLNIFIVTFATEPKSLKTIRPNTGTALVAKLLPNVPSHCADCRIDAHLQGLTPLNNGPNESDESVE